jgi:hypothetical protein
MVFLPPQRKFAAQCEYGGRAAANIIANIEPVNGYDITVACGLGAEQLQQGYLS